MTDLKKESLDKYDRRETFWSEKSLEQLGYSLIFFLTVGLAFLAFLVTQKSSYPKFHFNKEGDIEWGLVFYFSVLMLLFISVLFGSVAVISRLYDLRITRHITGMRKITLKSLDKYLPEGEVDLSKTNLTAVFFETLCKQIKFIHINPNSNFATITTDFNNLRKQAKLLGRITWTAHKIQIILILIATLIYCATIF